MGEVSERAVEEALKRIAGAHGVLPLKFVSPGVAGVPDRLLLAKAGCTVCGHARAAFVELKRPSGKLTALQFRVHSVLRSLGFRVGVIRSADEAEVFVKEWIDG